MARPKQFDRDRALAQAMYTFWEKGYAATNVPDLLTSMGISRSSLYESFTDKQTLFAETLKHYEHSGKQRYNLWKQAPSVKEGLRQFFSYHIAQALDDETPGGCFMSNTMVTFDQMDLTMQQLIEESFESFEQSLQRLLEQGQRTGEIAADRDIHSLVTLFHSLNHGINVMSKVNKNKKTYEQMVEEALKLI
ncbi:TetR/AcrR family transcriptional regulator [Aureibacillus halotolerans]|uniref:TetR family transcriptional regulator n=1 Tax=Aureibacillus halotolerans TaxID=1508390 RepID=A0A4R6U6M8_9BACI|nr:TetR/AcrR family transcriptional regulator [Aureibacillus halotolerans]TDQ40359.1 TetR family transcriptional regulator [Aureibacillus halotolerans]